jgi:hypothetical protein
MYALSNTDIDRLCPGSFMLYEDFDRVKNINSFLPIGTGKIILIRDSPNSGHYILLFRYDKNKYFFANSFGYKVDQQMKKYISKKGNELYNGGGNDLSRLLKSKSVSILNLPLQDAKTNVCGRFCIFFFRLFQSGLTLNESVKVLKLLKKEMGVSYDEIVVELIRL